MEIFYECSKAQTSFNSFPHRKNPTLQFMEVLELLTSDVKERKIDGNVVILYFKH